MPLVRIDAIEGRSKQQIRDVLDATHRAVVAAFGVPLRDRYQIYQAHSETNLIAEDTGLGIPRTRKIMIVTITSRPRSPESKQKFYEVLCRELEQGCGIDHADVVVSITINSDSDWSFGNGRAQFLTGEL